MQELNTFTPINSIIITSNWTLSIQFLYYKIVKNLRPDLVLLYYDIKFGNYKTLSLNYPDFSKKIDKEYINFINELKKEDANQIYNTGSVLSTPSQINAFKILLLKIKEISVKDNIPLMFDPPTYYTLGTQRLWEQDSVVFLSGYLISNKPTGMGYNFLKLNYKWLYSPVFLFDSETAEHLIVLDVAIDTYIDFYTNTHDYANLNQAIEARNKIKKYRKKNEKKYASYIL